MLPMSRQRSWWKSLASNSSVSFRVFPWQDLGTEIPHRKDTDETRKGEGATRVYGGDPVFYDDQVTLLDVTILVNSRSKVTRKILDVLRQKTSLGTYVARRCPKLVERLGLLGGQNAVAVVTV